MLGGSSRLTVGLGDGSVSNMSVVQAQGLELELRSRGKAEGGDVCWYPSPAVETGGSSLASWHNDIDEL